MSKTRATGTERKTWAMFGDYVRRLRQFKPLGLREMSQRAAEKSPGRGLSSAYLSRIEHGDTAPPRRAVLKVMAELLDVSEMRLDLVAQGWVILDVKTVRQVEGEQPRSIEKSDRIASLFIDPAFLHFPPWGSLASRALAEVDKVLKPGQVPTLEDLENAMDRLRSAGLQAKFEGSAGEFLLAVREQE